MNTYEAFTFMLSFKNSVVAERLGIEVNAVHALKFRYRRNTLTEYGMIGYLIRFGFPIEAKWGLPTNKKNAKKVQHKKP